MTEKVTIGIIGFGIVGRAMQHAFEEVADFRIYDINPALSENTLLETIEDSEFIFICVPTPMNMKTNQFDSRIIDSVMESITGYTDGTDKIIIIKSTVVPGTTQKYIDKYPESNIAFSPEFLTERLYLLDAINPSRIIFGVDLDKEEVNRRILEFYGDRFPQYGIYLTEPTVAELSKYASNAFFSVKLSFFNEMKQICDKLGIDYDEMIPLVIADGRIGNSHWKVPGHDGDYGFGGKCFPKDLNALIKKAEDLGVEPTILQATWKKNLEVRKKRDWEDIDGATS